MEDKNQWIWIHCDNHQTICLVIQKIAYLQTKLRHIDIHNHWLQQEVRNGQIAVEHVSIKKMITNRLTKTLSKSKFYEFLQQINLVDIASQILEHDVKENKQKELDHNSLWMYMRDFE